MEKIAVNVADYLSDTCIEKAIDSALNKLDNNAKDFESWVVIERLLQSFKTENKIPVDSARILEICRIHLKSPDEHFRIISKILNLLVEKCELTNIQQDLESLILDLQTSIINQSSSTHSDEG